MDIIFSTCVDCGKPIFKEAEPRFEKDVWSSSKVFYLTICEVSDDEKHHPIEK